MVEAAHLVEALVQAAERTLAGASALVGTGPAGVVLRHRTTLVDHEGSASTVLACELAPPSSDIRTLIVKHSNLPEQALRTEAAALH